MAEEIDSLGSIGAVGAADGTLLRDSTLAPPPVPPAAAPAVKPTPAASQRAGASVASANNDPPTLQQAVDQLNAQLFGAGRKVQLSVDPVTGITIATISDTTTGQVLQKIPSDDLIRLAQMLKDWSKGGNALVDLIA
ncbi:MAG TPA: flagellar protein FlaG [Steroidobacteraceae bacterium]|nr:flagellar protein FlaG [Steroidobacteraceae bacterium]